MAEDDGTLYRHFQQRSDEYPNAMSQVSQDFSNCLESYASTSMSTTSKMTRPSSDQRGQPRTKHAVSLLSASHQLFIEAMRSPFRHATLTLNMRKQFAPQPHRDYAWCLEHTWKRSEFRAVGKETMLAFQKAGLSGGPYAEHTLSC